MARHVHCELIKAWAEGAEIEFKNEHGNWMTVNPSWGTDTEYRIKPRIIRKEGWVNVFKYHDPTIESRNWIGATIFNSKEDAANDSPASKVDTIKIEWEETE